MAVDGAIAAAVLEEIGDGIVVLIDVVVEELERRATLQDTAALAKTALASKLPGWAEVNTDTVPPLEDVIAAQIDVADGRVLTDDHQHWAESTIIAMARQSAAAGSASIKVLLTEDYEARRVAARVPNMEALSIHKLLYTRVHATRMTVMQAADLADKLYRAGRAYEVTAADFADPTGRGLGRVGKP